ncbi:MAG: hypothetical protein AB1553_14850 [Nitrospirota bacterium]
MSIRVGILSEKLTIRIILFSLLIALLIIILLGYRAWMNTSTECVQCHGDRDRMEEEHAPWAYVTEETVRKESRHLHIQCRDCHLGNGRAKDKGKAHEGMLKMLIVSKEGTLLTRTSGYPYGLSRTGANGILAFLPKFQENGEWQFFPVRNILWHDRNVKSFNFDPDIAQKTCGKPGCHPEMVAQFKKTTMATNSRQRTMRTWLKPYGPHNCGPSFADLPPEEVLRSAAFSFKNTAAIAQELNTSFSEDQAVAKQKFCNVCHAGCLDCHYAPDEKEGVHRFTKKPLSESCGGYGRGTTICHPGAMQSRRGETYIGDDYSVPSGMRSDVHYRKNIHCIDCHPVGEKGMGDMRREADCQGCHREIEKAHARSIHKKLDCAACHISELRGYQITVWGPGIIAGKNNPFKKYSLYYGIQSPPILMKDQKGIWMPVKIWPHSVGNFRPEVKASEKLMFRWPGGETRDAYYIIGTFKTPSGNRHLLWFEIEQAAHPFGPARNCPSCHASPRQVSTSHWEFLDEQGAEPFKGGYKITADESGLRIEDMRNTTTIRLLKGYHLEDFASWLYLKDKWSMPGDFSIKVDQGKYKKYDHLSIIVKAKLSTIDHRSRAFDKKTAQAYRRLKGIALHNPEEGMK